MKDKRIRNRTEYFHQYYELHKEGKKKKGAKVMPPPIRRKYQNIYNENLKIEVLTHYGRGQLACVQCGFDNIDALSIDHIYGNGRQHRRTIGARRGGKRIYAWLRKRNFPDGFQTLCMNCQFIKRKVNNESN